MKILIIRFSSIGDIVLTTPIIRCLRKKYPNAQLHYLVKEKFKNTIHSNPNLDKVISFEGDLRDTVVELIHEEYDFVVDLQNSFRSLNITAMLRQAFNSKVKIFKVRKINIRKFIYTKLKVNILPDKSIVERYFATVKKLDVVNDGQGLDYFIPEEDKIGQKDLPMSHSAGYISFVIGGTKNTKKMPIQKWSELCKQLDYPIIIQGGAEDKEFGEELAKIDPIRIYNSCGKFSLHESADIIRFAKVVVTHDTGLMHIAAAYKRKIISIWGNTSPSFGMFPYYGYNNLTTNIAPESVMIESSKIGCRPCSKIGYDKCPKGHFKCMNRIDIAQIEASVQSLMKKAS